MPTSTKVKNLNINELTEAQYDAAVQGGVIGANELSVLTDVSYVEPSDLATVATTGDYSDLINRPTNLVSTNTAQTISGMKTFSGDITLSGTTSIKNNTGGTNYTMLYRDASTIHVGGSTSVLKLEGSGTRPAYNNDSLALFSDITGGLPSQTGHSGEFLTTDGTDASWAAVDALPSQTGHSGEFLTTDGTDASWATVDALPSQTGYSGRVLGTDGFVAGWVEPEIVQRSAMPVASQDEEGNIYQFIGTTDANYTHGYFYECVSDGGNPATYSWTRIDVQPSPNPLPSQTGQSGKFLTTDGTDASWSDITKVNTTVTLAAADWSAGTQTVTVNGITATSVVWVSPDPSDQADYVAGGILCTAQAANSLTFTASTTPTNDIDVVVVAM